jgi:nicotinamidase-related amidase
MPITALDDRTALVLVDLQVGITALAPDGLVGPVLSTAARLADGFRAAGLPVVLVRVQFSDDFADAPRNRTTTSLTGSPPPDYAEIHPGVRARPTDLLVTKRQPGAFHGTDLDCRLRRRGITGIVLGGLLTGLGVESTARAGYDHGYNLTVVEDASADVDPARHTNSLQRVFPLLGEVGRADDVLGLLEGRRVGG